MTSAIEIARGATASVDDLENQEAVAAAIQQAREDGARWMWNEMDNWSATSIAGVQPSDVRKVAP